MQVDRMISEIEEAYKGWKIGINCPLCQGHFELV